MRQYKYLIIGGGMTADAAAHAIREHDDSGSIGIIGQEAEFPYNRPPLTKGLWKGDSPENIWRDASHGAEFHLRTKIEQIMLSEKQALDDRHETYQFEKLLIATGGRPRQLPFGEDHIIYYRTIEDYRRLYGMTAKHKRFAVIGSGFIGSEIAAALAMNDKEVAMVFPGDGICSRMFPTDLSQFITNYYREKGVELYAGESPAALEIRHGEMFLKMGSGKEALVAAVVAGIGIEPNVELAESAGLKVDDGIIVNEFCQTTNPDIYAAGDVARFFNPALNQFMRVEHEDNANTMGRIAGQNMAGARQPYHHLPFFYSDLFDFGYEAVGELDSRLDTYADWETPCRQGIVYYLKDRRVRGVLLWGVFGQVDAARKLIAQAGPFGADDLKGRLPTSS